LFKRIVQDEKIKLSNKKISFLFHFFSCLLPFHLSFFFTQKQMCVENMPESHACLTHYPATLQSNKATRPCKAGLPPVLEVKQAKGLTCVTGGVEIDREGAGECGIMQHLLWFFF
jgi:hypothetical protein